MFHLFIQFSHHSNHPNKRILRIWWMLYKFHRLIFVRIFIFLALLFHDKMVDDKNLFKCTTFISLYYESFPSNAIHFPFHCGIFSNLDGQIGIFSISKLHRKMIRLFLAVAVDAATKMTLCLYKFVLLVDVFNSVLCTKHSFTCNYGWFAWAQPQAASSFFVCFDFSSKYSLIVSQFSRFCIFTIVVWFRIFDWFACVWNASAIVCILSPHSRPVHAKYYWFQSHFCVY